uniref:Endo/exonuclease/phosphatase domain-containing protein n=1 Tax=Parastrongyloides trichosuri TaxID=131310 RepID=A0A0N4ZPI7_PARTI
MSRKNPKKRDCDKSYYNHRNYGSTRRKKDHHFDPLFLRSNKYTGNVRKRKDSVNKFDRNYQHDKEWERQKGKYHSFNESPIHTNTRGRSRNITTKRNRFIFSELPRSSIQSPSSSPEIFHKRRASIETDIPIIPVIQLDKSWRSDHGNASTVYTLSDFENECEVSNNMDGNIIQGYYLETKSYARHIKKLNNSGEGSCDKKINHRLPRFKSDKHDNRLEEKEDNNDTLNTFFSGFFPSSHDSPTSLRIMKQMSGTISKIYQYERCQASYPVPYNLTKNYCQIDRPYLFQLNPESYIICDPITKYTINNNVPFRRLETINEPSDNINSSIFSIKSYNILSQFAAMNHLEMYQHLVKKECHDGHYDIDINLKEEYRYKKILAELLNYQCDIICLQECDKGFYEKDLEKEFKKIGFLGEYIQKNGCNFNDGCAILYSSKFNLLSKKNIRYSDYIAGHDIKPQVAQILEFEINHKKGETSKEKTRLFVANTHILYNPKRGDVKLSQIACLLSHLQDMVNNCKYPCAYIMCGDFNMQPYSKMYNFIVDGECSISFDRQTFSGQISVKGVPTIRIVDNKLIRGSLFDHKCQLVDKNCGDYYGPYKHGLKFASVYKHYTGKEKLAEISTYHTCDAANPDYIFYGVQSRVVEKSLVNVTESETLSLLKRLSLPDEYLIAKHLGPMPNNLTGSDHLPLMAQFQLT